ncbi:ABC transporter substrate-binding protein [Candidatus Pacebacteria bacterium]|nr:ABC transporter substrate-binding protein [Candidatus Paceibacterota bacterium]
MNKKAVFGLTSILIMVAIIAVNRPDIEDNNQTIRIGGISARTGVGAPIGDEEYKGALLAVEEINKNGGIDGRKIEFVSEDLSIDRLKDAGSVANKLVNIDKVLGIIGPQWDEPAMAILPITEEAKVSVIGPDTSDTIENNEVGEYLFSTWYDNRAGIDVILKHAESQGIKRMVIIRAIDAGFWKFVSDDFSNKAEQYGIEIVDDITLGNAFTTDFRTTIIKIKEKNPDAVFSVTTDPVQCPLFKQFNELGFDKPVFATEAAGNQASLGQCPGVLENLYFSTPINENKKFSDFELAFEKRFGSKPAFPSAVTAYDAVYVLANALEKTNGEGGEALQKALSETKGLEGASQPILTFKENGFVETPVDIFQMRTVRNGEFVPVE